MLWFHTSSSSSKLRNTCGVVDAAAAREWRGVVATSASKLASPNCQTSPDGFPFVRFPSLQNLHNSDVAIRQSREHDEEPGEGGAAGRRRAARQRGPPPGLRLLHLRRRRRGRRLGLPRGAPDGRRRRGQGRRRRRRGRGGCGARRLRPAHRPGARHLRLRQRQAGRPLVLRRRGEQGRPGAGAGPGLAHQRPRQGAGALLLPQGRARGLRRGAQPRVRALPVRPRLRARPLPGVGRGPPGALRRPLRRRAGRPAAPADAPRPRVRVPRRRHLRRLGAQRHLPLRRAQRHHARVPRRRPRRRRLRPVAAPPLPPPGLPRRQPALPLARPPVPHPLLRLRLRPLRRVAPPRRRAGARGHAPRPPWRRRPVRHGGLGAAGPDDPGRGQDQRAGGHVPAHLLLQLRQPAHRRRQGGAAAADPPAALRPRPADAPLALPRRRRRRAAVPGVQGRGLGGQRRRAQHLLHDAPEGPRRAPQRPGRRRRGLPSAATGHLVLQDRGGGPHDVRHQPPARWRAVRPHLRQHLPKLPEACLPDGAAADASESELTAHRDLVTANYSASLLRDRRRIHILSVIIRIDSCECCRICV